MKFLAIAVSLATALLAATADRATEIAAETRLAAQHVAVMTCANCHGPQGRSFAPKFPMLAGQHAGYLEALSHMPWDGFQASTADVKDTAAKPEIYKEPDKFKAQYEKLQTEVGKLAFAAKSGDQNAVKAAFGDVGKACKACHDDFQVKR